MTAEGPSTKEHWSCKEKKKLISEKLKVKLPKIKFRQKVLCDSQIVNNLNKNKNK